MGKKILLGTAFAVAAFGLASRASADTFTFNISGTGATPTVVADTLDWAPGNTLVQENAAGTAATILFQANLNAALLSSVPQISQGAGGAFVTVTAALTAVELSPGVFSFNPGQTITVYADTTGGGNDLAGTGFVGTPILTATTNGAGFGSLFLVPPPTLPLVALDNHGTDNYPGVTTEQATSGSVINLQAVIQSFNPAYFGGLIDGTTLTITDGSNVVPFAEVDPAKVFFNGALGVSNGGICAVVGPGCVNGSTDNIIAEADLATTFRNTAAIPEPATLTLLGVGLISTAAARRRQKKNQK
jgi:hypothetical protein